MRPQSRLIRPSKNNFLNEELLQGVISGIFILQSRPFLTNQEIKTVQIENIESLMVAILVPGLIAHMLYIIYKLGKESQAGKFGMFVLFGVLAFGMVGFGAKYVIKAFII